MQVAETYSGGAKQDSRPALAFLQERSKEPSDRS